MLLHTRIHLWRDPTREAQGMCGTGAACLVVLDPAARNECPRDGLRDAGDEPVKSQERVMLEE